MNALIEKIKNEKKYKIAIIAILCAVVLIIYFLPEKSNNHQEPSISNNTEVVTKEKQLEQVLSNMSGVGKVSVMITYESGNEVVCASNTEKQTNTVTEKSENGGIRESETVTESKSPVTIGSGEGEDALVVIEKEPQIKGVIVVAQGAEVLKVKLALQSAVETVLQISPGQVEIFAMK